MSYYQVCKILLEQGWKSVRIFDNKETWVKEDKSFVISIQDNLPKKMVESILHA